MSQVYFLYAPSVNLMKIGRSVEPERRFAELRLLSPVPLEVFGVIDGGAEKEFELHQRFSHLHSHGEWFHATAELKDFASVEAMLCLWGKTDSRAREIFLSSVRRGPA